MSDTLSLKETRGRAWSFEEKPGMAMWAFRYLCNTYLLSQPLPPGLLAFVAGLESQRPPVSYLALLWKEPADVAFLTSHVESTATLTGGKERISPFHLFAPIVVRRSQAIQESPDSLIIGSQDAGLTKFLFVR